MKKKLNIRLGKLQKEFYKDIKGGIFMAMGILILGLLFVFVVVVLIILALIFAKK